MDTKHEIDDLSMKAKFYHDQGDRMRALAMNENNNQGREALHWIAEYYYLLHDRYVELARVQRAAPNNLDDQTCAQQIASAEAG